MSKNIVIIIYGLGKEVSYDWKLAKGHWSLSVGIAHSNDETFLELELFKWVVLIGLMYK